MAGDRDPANQAFLAPWPRALRHVTASVKCQVISGVKWRTATFNGFSKDRTLVFHASAESVLRFRCAGMETHDGDLDVFAVCTHMFICCRKPAKALGCAMVGGCQFQKRGSSKHNLREAFCGVSPRNRIRGAEVEVVKSPDARFYGHKTFSERKGRGVAKGDCIVQQLCRRPKLPTMTSRRHQRRRSERASTSRYHHTC